MTEHHQDWCAAVVAAARNATVATNNMAAHAERLENLAQEKYGVEIKITDEMLEDNTLFSAEVVAKFQEKLRKTLEKMIVVGAPLTDHGNLLPGENIAQWDTNPCSDILQPQNLMFDYDSEEDLPDDD